MFGAIAGGIASALAGGAMSKLFGVGQKAASGGIQGDVLASDNNTVGMGDAGIKSAIQGSNVPNPDEAVPSFVSGAMAKAGKGLLEGTLQAGTSAVSDKLLDLVGLGGKSAADNGKDTRDYLAAAFPELNAWERAGADASSAGMVDADRGATARGALVVGGRVVLPQGSLALITDPTGALVTLWQASEAPASAR